MPTSESQTLADQLVQSLREFLPRSNAFPDLLHRAMHYAVFSGGKLGRPRLLLAVHAICGSTAESMPLALRAACAIEYIHAGSLVHDDLPCFDDALQRRGKPSTHAAFGEAMAVLVGDALLSRAFEVVADVAPAMGMRALRIIRLMGATTGSSNGVIGGQSLEQQLSPAHTPKAAGPLSPADFLDRYHSMKTAALFRLAAEAGAVAAGAEEVQAWGEIGEHLGLAYQLAIEIYRSPSGTTAKEGAPSVGPAVRSKAMMSLRETQIAKMRRLLEHAKQRSAALVPNSALLAEIANEIDTRSTSHPSEESLFPSTDRTAGAESPGDQPA